MFHLIIKRRVVIYPSFVAPPEIIQEGLEGTLTFGVFVMEGGAIGEGGTEFIPFDEECRMRRVEFAGDCLRKPDEEFLALRRAPECPTSRYCFDDCVD